MKEGEAEQRHGARVIMITRRRTVWTGCGSPRQRPSSCHAQVPSAAITRRPRCPSAASLGRSGRTNGRGSSLRRSLRCSEASERPLLILYRNDGFSYTVCNPPVAIRLPSRRSALRVCDGRWTHGWTMRCMYVQRSSIFLSPAWPGEPVNAWVREPVRRAHDAHIHPAPSSLSSLLPWSWSCTTSCALTCSSCRQTRRRAWVGRAGWRRAARIPSPTG